MIGGDKMRKKKYYDIRNVLKTAAEYIILLGMRSNGKSYQVKKTILEEAYKTNNTFVYLRRYREDIKQGLVDSYFSDMPIEEITEGNYNAVIAWQGFLYFATVDDAGKAEKGRKIGRYCALSEAIRYKSTTFIDCKYIVYEEFITDEIYLNDEPTKLQQFVSTVARGEKLTVFLIGNTMSRVCPYFSEWSLKGTLKQKPGTIELYHMHYTKPNGEINTVTIAVEHCEVIDTGASMFFGSASKQIVSGEWDVKDAPKLPRPFKEYEKLYEMQVKYSDFIFALVMLCDDNGRCYAYVYPAKELDEKKRIISNEFFDNENITNGFNRKSRAECKLIELFAQGKVCYSDNLTAADFTNVRKQFRFI